MKNAVIYYTDQVDEKKEKSPGHQEGKKLLATGLQKEYGLVLEKEEVKKGPHGKPYLASCPGIHYNISHSGKYAACIFSENEVGLDIQVHKKVNYERMLKRMVPEEMIFSILARENQKEEFFRQWSLREAYIKWTGEGLSRDLRTIPFHEGWHQAFCLGEECSGGVWAGEPLCLRWEYFKG